MSNIIEMNKIVPEKHFNGDRLRIARNYRGMTATELAEKVGIKRQTISMYENSKSSNPEIENLRKIGEVLEFPLKFFLENTMLEVENNTTYFRALLTTNKKYRIEQETKVEFISIIYKYLNDFLDFEPLNLPILGRNTTPKEAAKELREYWDLGDGPILNLIYIVESNGIAVIDFDTMTGDVDAYSRQVEFDDRVTYLIGYSKNKTTASRLHFDIAHELGHIMLHNWKEDLENISKEEFKLLEKEANEFASEFLLPEETFKADVYGYENKVPYYIEMKKQWHVSIAAMIRRSYTLGLIDNEEYQRMMRYMQKQGIRKREPLDGTLTTAPPSLLRQAICTLLKEGVFTPREFMSALSVELGLSLYANDVEKLLGLKEGTLEVEIEPVISIKIKK